MAEPDNINRKQDFIFVITLVIMVLSIFLFNYIVDPYYIFRKSTIIGFNNVKTHKYTNKRTILYSDMKINHKGKEIAFTGNCLLSNYGYGRDNIAFFTIPMIKMEEALNVIKSIHSIAPDIKKIYLGMFFDELWNDKNKEITDFLPELDSKRITYKDIINLFFSWNTTKYSIETVRDSIKNKGKDIIYIYPYRELAKKTYDTEFSFDVINKIKEIYDYAKENNLELIIYYSPIHISKKVHLYLKDQWDRNMELKKRIAQITPFFDYSFENEYNMAPLDEHQRYFIDNIHPSAIFNNIIIDDLLSDNKQIGVLITNENVDKYIKEDTENVINFINRNKALTERLKMVKKEDVDVKILKAN